MGRAPRVALRGLVLRHVARAVALVALLLPPMLAAPPSAGAVAPPKVAIIVGPSGTETTGHRALANATARTAALYTPNVVRVYSPSATWTRVETAAADASVLVYIGGGRGFPAPGRTSLDPALDDGFQLNPSAAANDSSRKLYGEAYIRTLRLAPRALVVLVDVPYAAGQAGSEQPAPTPSVARRRADNYAAGFLGAGAAAVVADTADPAYYVQAVFTRNASLDSVWRSSASRHGHVTTFSSSRTRGAVGRTDPADVAAGFDRSIVGWPATATMTVRREPASCRGTLQAKVDAAAPGSTLDLTGCSYAAGATVTKPLTISGATIRPGPGTAGLTVKANDVTIDGVRIVGPQATEFREGEFGITASATASTPVLRLTIRNAELSSFGKAGVWLRYVNDLVVEHSVVQDAVYAGIALVSGRNALIDGNSVSRIGVHGAGANEDNAYGIVLTDQGLPVTSDVVVSNNTVSSVPTWHALDTHGAVRVQFTGNAVFGSPRALFITSDNAGRRSRDITATANYFGSPAPVTRNLLAVTTYDTVGVTITGNTAQGWPAGLFFEDYRGLSTGLVVSGNSILP